MGSTGVTVVGENAGKRWLLLLHDYLLSCGGILYAGRKKPRRFSLQA